MPSSDGISVNFRGFSISIFSGHSATANLCLIPARKNISAHFKVPNILDVSYKNILCTYGSDKVITTGNLCSPLLMLGSD
jgi:hypothetical protein